METMRLYAAVLRAREKWGDIRPMGSDYSDACTVVDGRTALWVLDSIGSSHIEWL